MSLALIVTSCYGYWTGDRKSWPSWPTAGVASLRDSRSHHQRNRLYRFEYIHILNFSTCNLVCPCINMYMYIIFDSILICACSITILVIFLSLLVKIGWVGITRVLCTIERAAAFKGEIDDTATEWLALKRAWDKEQPSAGIEERKVGHFDR